MKTLDFMIVGVQKSGTTALSHFLSQHPQIDFATCKEVHLFDATDFSSQWTVEEINERYAPYFSQEFAKKICGEATPIYIYWKEIAAQLQRYNPELKLIVVLRDPIARALSHYAMEKSRGNERLPLWLALLLEPLRLRFTSSRVLGSGARCHSYVDRGFYEKQIKNLQHYFPDEQILIIENTELMQEHNKTLSNIYEFLNVGADELVEQAKIFAGDYNKSLHPFYDIYLRWRFKSANRKLKLLLENMGYSPTWLWLE